MRTKKAIAITGGKYLKKRINYHEMNSSVQFKLVFLFHLFHRSTQCITNQLKKTIIPYVSVLKTV
jgi:hypothetical protein